MTNNNITATGLKILGLDLGKFHSAACLLDTATGEVTHAKLASSKEALRAYLETARPDRVVLEACPMTGWVCDAIGDLAPELVVAHVGGEAWKWNLLKRKTDRDDALKLAQLSMMGGITQVHVPSPEVRQKRGLIRHRKWIVRQITKVKNQVQATLLREGIVWSGPGLRWTLAHRRWLAGHARPMADCGFDELWKGLVDLSLGHLDRLEQLLEQADAKLVQLAAADERVDRLRQVPGVGPRLAEAVVAAIDDPHRFKSSRQVGAYVGLVPKQYQSGTSDRRGRITKQGPTLLRSLLVEASWMAIRYNPWLRRVYEQVCGGSKTRKKIAIVAVARRLLIALWAMLRDGSDWRPPAVRGPAVVT
jgi:transposase